MVYKSLFESFSIEPRVFMIQPSCRAERASQISKWGTDSAGCWRELIPSVSVPLDRCGLSVPATDRNALNNKRR